MTRGHVRVGGVLKCFHTRSLGNTCNHIHDWFEPTKVCATIHHVLPKAKFAWHTMSWSHLYKGSHMKLFATLTAGLLFGLAACQSTPTTAPGAVSGCCGGKSCSTDGACSTDKSKCTTAACKDKVAAASPGAVSETKSACCKDKSAAASPGAVSETKSGCSTPCSEKAAATSPGAVSETKTDCHSNTSGCPMTGAGSCPFSGKTNG